MENRREWVKKHLGSDEMASTIVRYDETGVIIVMTRAVTNAYRSFKCVYFR